MEKRLRFSMESDKLYSCIFDNGEELTCFELVDLLNEQQATIEAKNEYQRTLEAKIRRLKNRIKILEKAEGWQN